MDRKNLIILTLVMFLPFAATCVVWADNATQILVEISYPCLENQDVCDTGNAVSREINGDIVNVYITLLDSDGNPATAGPNGELLGFLTATVSTNLGETIVANQFLADAAVVSFGNDATARANIDYTGALPGTDQVVAIVISEPEILVGQAAVNIVAPPGPPATNLVVRTLRNANPPHNLYDPIPDPAGNRDGWEPAGADVQVTVLADLGGGLFVPDPRLEGKTVIVKAYADYSEDGVAGGGVLGADIPGSFEEELIAEKSFTISGGQVTDTIRITTAGPADPEGLKVVFTAEIDEDGGISTTLMNGAGLELQVGNDFTLDTVEMRSMSPDGLLIAMDPYGNGNLVLEEDCLVVFDDDFGFGAGTPVPFEVILVDIWGNATRAIDDVLIAIDLWGGELEDQLDATCDIDAIASGDYNEDCVIVDVDPTLAGQVITQGIIIDGTGVAPDMVTIDLVPASAPGTLDLTVTVDLAGQDIDAGDEVVLTLDNVGGYFPFMPGEIIEISATAVPGGPQLISTSDFAAATNTLELAAYDDDPDTLGLQLQPISIFGHCTVRPDENVIFSVIFPARCDVTAYSDAINDLDPYVPANLAVVGLADGLETDTELDVPNYLGNDPVNVTTPLIADGITFNEVLDCGDLEVWDAFDNVLEDTPELACAVELGFLELDFCDVSARWVIDAADTTQLLVCEAIDYPDIAVRTLSIPLIEEEGEPPSDAATALVARQEGPQTQDGDQTVPCGEAIVQIYANGTLGGDVPILISFGEGTVEGAELRTLGSDTPLAVPFVANLSSGEVIRLVIYSPSAGPVIIKVRDLSGIEPLDPAELHLVYCPPCDADDDCDGSCNPGQSAPGCTGSDNCPTEYNPSQEDMYPPGGNGIGDACDCEGNLNCDDDCDGSDAFDFKIDFGRSLIANPCESGNPCNGDFDCDNDCDGSDAFIFKEDFGRSPLGNPCPVCTAVEWCTYP